MKTARKHERFIEDLGDDIRVTPGFGFYLRPSYFFWAHMQSSVSGLASLLSEHELDNTPRSSEAVWRGHCSVRGRELQSPFFSEVFMVPRPLAPARSHEISHTRRRYSALSVQVISLPGFVVGFVRKIQRSDLSARVRIKLNTSLRLCFSVFVRTLASECVHVFFFLFASACNCIPARVSVRARNCAYLIR